MGRLVSGSQSLQHRRCCRCGRLAQTYSGQLQVSGNSWHRRSGSYSSSKRSIPLTSLCLQFRRQFRDELGENWRLPETALLGGEDVEFRTNQVFVMRLFSQLCDALAPGGRSEAAVRWALDGLLRHVWGWIRREEALYE